MKDVACLMLSVLMALFAKSAWAEQGCPPGQYPIGGQGAVSCAPIPQESPIQQQPRPSGKWIKTWGAVASDDNGANFGVSTGKLEKSEAEKDAVVKCEGASQKKCDVVSSYKNQCISAAKPAGVGDVIFARGPSIEVTSKDAMSSCSKKNSVKECKIIYTACTEPVFQEF